MCRSEIGVSSSSQKGDRCDEATGAQKRRMSACTLLLLLLLLRSLGPQLIIRLIEIQQGFCGTDLGGLFRSQKRSEGERLGVCDDEETKKRKKRGGKSPFTTRNQAESKPVVKGPNG